MRLSPSRSARTSTWPERMRKGSRTSTKADGTAPQEDDAHTGTSADGTPQNEASEEEPSEEEEDVSEEEEEEDAPEEENGDDNMSVDVTGPHEEEEDELSKRLENEEDGEWRMCNDDALEPSQQQQEDRRKTDDGFVVGNRARFRKVDDIMAEVDRSNKSKAAEGKNSEAPSGDPASEGEASIDSLAELERRPAKKSKAEEGKRPAASFIVYTRSAALASKGRRRDESASKGDSLAVRTGVFAPESVCRDLTTWHKSFGKKHSKQNQFPMFNKSNGENQAGRVLTKVQRRPGLTSQRRPVTQREKEDAMGRARRFKSERPFAVKAMKHTDIYASYFMIIPDKFVEKFLPKDSRKMTLWDPQAKPWKVWYEYTGGECPRAAFSAGWGALAVENNLEKWDVCVFELLDQEYNIKLHVHRVVREITPCVLAPTPPTEK